MIPDRIEHLVHFSGGITSWEVARRVAAERGTERLVLLFVDTLIEDQDSYRFIVEAAAQVLGAGDVSDLAARARALPEEWDPERKGLLQALRADAMRRISGLVWDADGRTPWEVFRDERMIGNSRIDPCSKHLKRRRLDAWRQAHCDPGAVTVYVGINFDEDHRLKKLQERAAPWRFDSPLCYEPYAIKPQMLDDARALGLEPPRLYSYPFSHANCGGFCVKGGHAHFKTLLEHFPERFAHHEEQEAILMEDLGSEWGILNDRTGGTRTPLPLSEFRRRVQGETPGSIDEDDHGPTCGCAIFEEGEADHFYED